MHVNDNRPPCPDDEPAPRMVPIIGDVREGKVIFRRNGKDLLDLRPVLEGEPEGF